MSKPLVLPVKNKWFGQIKAGSKKEEYRLYNPFWRKRLEGKSFSKVIITLGYPKKSDSSRRLLFEFNGIRVTEIRSDEFGPDMQKVFAINLSKPIAHA